MENHYDHCCQPFCERRDKVIKTPRNQRAGTRLAILVGLAAVLGGGLWFYSRRGPVPVKDESEAGLLRLLGGTEEEAPAAQEEMERRFGTNDVSRWKRALDAPESRARSLAIESIGRKRSPAAAKLLTAALEDPASSVRINAVEALSAQDPALALRPMLAAVEDDDTWVSEAAANKIRELKRREAVPELIAALRNPDRETGVFALGALKRLTGEKFHASKTDGPETWNRMVRQWEGWWQSARAGWPASPDADGVKPIRPGRAFPAADFEVTDASGTTISLKGLRGKVVLVNFWMLNCGPCIAEMKGLDAVASRYRDQGLVVLGVENNGEDGGKLREYAVQHHVGYALAAGNDSIRQSYGHIHDVPVSFLIDRQGRVRYEWEGDREERVFDAAVKHVLAQ